MSDRSEFVAPDQHAYDLPYHWCMRPFYKFVVGEAVSRVSHLIKNRKVIEVGCGDGFVTSLLARTAQSVLAFDINERAIAFAQLIMSDPHVNCGQGRARDIASFAKRIAGGPQTVVAFEVIEHLSSDELGTFLHSSRKILEPTRGWLLITTPNWIRRSTQDRNPYHATEFSPFTLRSIIEEVGFRNVDISGLYLQPPWPRLEHFSDTIPFRSVFRVLARAGSTRPHLCRTLVCCAQAR